MNKSINFNNNNKIIFDSITTSPLNNLLNIQQKEQNITKDQQERGIKENNLPTLKQLNKLNLEINISNKVRKTEQKRELILLNEGLRNPKYPKLVSISKENSFSVIEKNSDNAIDYDYKLVLNKVRAKQSRRFDEVKIFLNKCIKSYYIKYNKNTELTSNNMIVTNDNMLNNLENKNNSLLNFYPNNIINNQDLNLYDLKANKLINYLKLLSDFNPELVKNKDILYNFNKSANPSRKSVYTLLNSSLKNMKALISNPNYYSSSNQVEVYLNIYYSFKKLSKQIKTIYIRLIKLPIILNQSKDNVRKINQIIFNFKNSNSLNDPNKYLKYYSIVKEKNKIIKQYLSLKREYNYLLNSYSFLNRNIAKIEYLCEILTQIFNKPVVLNLTRVHKPSYDSNILAQLIGKVSNKIKLNSINKKTLKNAKIIKPTFLSNKSNLSDNPLTSLLKGNLLPAFLSGFKVKVHGRLLTQRVIPRRTVKIIQGGSLARGKADLINKARYTNKNKRGAYSITITTGHTINKLS